MSESGQKKSIIIIIDNMMHSVNICHQIKPRLLQSEKFTPGTRLTRIDEKDLNDQSYSSEHETGDDSYWEWGVVTQMMSLIIGNLHLGWSNGFDGSLGARKPPDHCKHHLGTGSIQGG